MLLSILGSGTVGPASVALGADPRPRASEAAISSEERQFFEKQVRPLLIKHCYQCHSIGGEGPQGGPASRQPRRMDEGGRQRSGDRARRAGREPPDRGDSLRIARDASQGEAAGLRDRRAGTMGQRWGRPIPRTEPAPTKPARPDLDAGRSHWAFRPIADAARAAGEGRGLAALRRRPIRPRQARVGGAVGRSPTPTGRPCCGASSSTWSASRRPRPRSRRSSRTTPPTRSRRSSMRSWPAPNSASAGAVTGSTSRVMPTPTARTRTSPITTPGVIATT